MDECVCCGPDMWRTRTCSLTSYYMIGGGRILFILSRNGWSGHEAEKIVHGFLLNQCHVWKCLKTAWCFGCFGASVWAGWEKRKETEKVRGESVTERGKGAGLLTLFNVCLIFSRQHQSCKYHNNSLTPWSRSAQLRHGGKQPCYIILFYTVDHLLTECLTDGHCEHFSQCASETLAPQSGNNNSTNWKVALSVMSMPTGDFRLFM